MSALGIHGSTSAACHGHPLHNPPAGVIQVSRFNNTRRTGHGLRSGLLQDTPTRIQRCTSYFAIMNLGRLIPSRRREICGAVKGMRSLNEQTGGVASCNKTLFWTDTSMIDDKRQAWTTPSPDGSLGVASKAIVAALLMHARG